MSYCQHFFIRARPGAVRQPDCKAVLLRQRSLTERHRYGAVARYRSDTGSEPNMTSGNSWEKRQVCGIDKIEIGTQLFEVKLCAACRTQQVVCKSSRSKRRGARCTVEVRCQCRQRLQSRRRTPSLEERAPSPLVCGIVLILMRMCSGLYAVVFVSPVDAVSGRVMLLGFRCQQSST